MKEFIEKLISRLEEQQAEAENEMHRLRSGDYTLPCSYDITDLKEIASESFKESKEIVNQLAEEYKSRVMIDNEYCWQKCSAVEHCKECSRLGNGTIDYFENYDSLIEEHKEKDCFNCSRRTWYQKGYADAMEHIKYINTPNDTTSSYCEWKIDGVYLMCQHKTELFISCLEEEKYRYKYCPICGKKIKVVE